MSNVTLQIAGRSYTVACAAGEEEHVTKLGASIDAKLAAMPNIGAQSEPRALLFAALLLADELHEKSGGLAPPAAATPADTAANASAEQAEALENLANRLESIAAGLESA